MKVMVGVAFLGAIKDWIGVLGLFPYYTLARVIKKRLALPCCLTPQNRVAPSVNRMPLRFQQAYIFVLLILGNCSLEDATSESQYTIFL